VSNYSFVPEKTISSYRKSDTGFIISVILLWGLGIFTLFVCSNVSGKETFGDSLYFFKRQLIASAVGFVGLLFFAICPLDKQRKLLPILFFGTIFLCILTFIPGIKYERNGASRWIKMPFFTFQPSELVKFTIVLFLANYFDKYARLGEANEQRSVGTAIFVITFFVSLIFFQKDFSTGVFVLFCGIIICFISNAKMLWLIPFSILGIPAVMLLILTEEYRVNRIAAHFNPAEYAQTFGYQGLAAKKAIQIGGFWGQGIGEGLEKMNNIPEVQSDYIFAGWTEAMGFVGVILYFALLVFFLIKGIQIALKCPDRFASFGCMGCMIVIFLQSILNISVVCGIVPTTGIPLPFFSSGGSSIIVTLCMCGFIINASRCDYDTYTENKTSTKNVEEKYETLDINLFK